MKRSRQFRDRTATLAFRLAGYFSIAVLLGIFSTLLVNATTGFTMGSEVGDLTPQERAFLGDADVRALRGQETGAPSVFADFLADTVWQPTSTESARYGVLAMVVSTLLTTLAAMAMVVPVGLCAAAWLAMVAPPRLAAALKFAIEMLAAIPSVVVGFVGVELLGPLVGRLFGVPGGLVGLNGAVLLAIMALPTMISMSEDAISAVPKGWVHGSLALGADRFQTLLRVVLPASQSGLVAAAMLGMGRAIGETMTVLMVCGNSVAMPQGLLDPMRTMTATIAIELGEVPRGSRHYYLLFAVGLLLFVMTLIINSVASWAQRRARRLGG